MTDLAHHLRPGDTVIVGQAAAEPEGLVEQLIAAATRVEGLTAFCGYTLSRAWERATPGRPRIATYAAHAALRGLRGVDVLPLHLSRVEEQIVEGRIPADVVLLQVGPIDATGCYNLGATVDYAIAAAERARVVLVEVNTTMPRTRSARGLHPSLVTAAIPTSRPLPGAPSRPATDVERGVATTVASLVPDGAAIQIGVGSLADAIAAGLRSRSGLRVHSGLVGDWLVGLHESGALAEGPGAVLTGMALGGEKLYDFLGGNDDVEFAPTAVQLDPVAIAACSPFVAINSAIEVDLLGQLNAEVAGGRYLGAVGGQVDFFRAAQRSRGGLAIVALPSVTASGASRIVPRLDAAVVTSLKSDVDVVATEWGVADLRACSMRERIERIARIAHPDHRERLARHQPDWL